MIYYTTVEQSEHLVELGLSFKSSDMCYPKKSTFENDYAEKPVCHYSGIGLTIPCWSLGALLEVMPESYQLTRGKDNKYQFMLFHILIHDWFNTPLEAVYNMVCYLLENGLIKNCKS